ncbi:MAG: oligopeptide/dipeptide ABC transporter ATP-binding protein [Myxococcota bacterium]
MGDFLEVRRLEKAFPVERGLFRRTVGSVHAVRDLTFSVGRGKTFAVVGESGCGKTTLARLILRLLEPDRGEIALGGEALTTLQGEALRRTRRRVQMVFQDPVSSLNPRLTVEQTLSGPMRAHGISDHRARARALLEQVGLAPHHLGRYPHEFSGGQRQRIAIARAIAVGPELLVADEPVSALDVSIQAQILNLFLELQASMSLTYVFIAHDLSVVRHLANRVAVMYLGRIVEVGARDAIFDAPAHPYTRSLLSAVPRLGRRSERVTLVGEAPSPLAPPSGCSLHPRCPFAFDRCRVEAPKLVQLPGVDHEVACHLQEQA